MNKIIVILGPTATGKTALSTKLAAHFNGEIVSADSMQIYKGMDIGTAKVTKEEMNDIPHHLIDIVAPSEDFSLADYIDLANQTIEEIIKRGKIPFIVGGTGLYITTLTDNIVLSPSGASPEYRSFLNQFADHNGGHCLRELLKQIDIESYEKLNDADVKRVSRALEIYRDSGKTVSEYNKESKQPAKYEFLKIGLNYSDRELLYKKINERVDTMMEAGLLDEVEKLDLKKLSSTASQAIGYRQFFDFFDGRCTIDDVVFQIKQESRRYAKRQITWFKRDCSIKWHNIDTNISEEIFKKCVQDIEKFLKM